MTDENDLPSKAVIYCRVSHSKQKTQGDGLNSQETRCREFAQYKGYEVVRVFADDASGSLIDRPGMKAMLAFLRLHRREAYAVIIDDISRLARGIETHLQLRAAISGAGGILQSPSIEFGEDSDSILVENMMATVSQYQRQKNGEQTFNRMRARVMNGYSVFRAPVGYRYKVFPGKSKVLVRDEPMASVVAEALNGFASGRFQTQSEVKRFLEAHPQFPRSANGMVHFQRIPQILTAPIYAGYVGVPEWGVSLRKGQHEGLITYDTHLKIQQRLQEGAKVPSRKNLSEDFPLRGAVVCGHCQTPFTACWSTGRSGRHPYYLCRRKGCLIYGKSVPRARMEGDFEALLKTLQPTHNLFQAASKMLEDLWNGRLAARNSRNADLKREVAQVKTQTEHFLDRIASTSTDALIRSYEDRIQKLEERRLLLEEMIAFGGKPLRSFAEALRTALSFLANPHQLWVSDRFEDKRAVLKLAFAGRLAYVRNEGFRTVDLALPFKALEAISTGQKNMVGPE